ncbi:hypothetical protein GCM10027589_16510 [Actinocorallia lasiicapitis]
MTLIPVVRPEQDPMRLRAQRWVTVDGGPGAGWNDLDVSGRDHEELSLKTNRSALEPAVEGSAA